MTSNPSAPAARSLSLIEQALVLSAALIASLIAVGWSWRNHAFLLYGDAEAHIHIARRLFDSHRPGLTQLGSVWLPLPHLLLVPFIAVDSWWRSGFGAAIPSALCYVLSCLGLYRLLRNWIDSAASCIALMLFAANPNLLYLQTTAMTEPLFLCELIWSVLLLVEWHTRLDAKSELSISQEGRSPWPVIAVLIAAVYTRYDGWILAFLAWLAMAVCLARRGRLLRRRFILASVLLLAAPVSWMVYNAVVFGDWLDFARGPYSAKAIELRTAGSSIAPHPGWHNPWVALLYFAKAAEMDAVALGWGNFLLLVAVVGTGLALFFHRRRKSVTAATLHHPSVAWTLLLWLPLPFYAYSVSYGSVPIFLPVWYPHSWYNTRYGMELLPALALFTGFSIEGLLSLVRGRVAKYQPILLVGLFVLLAANVVEMLHEQPLTYVEGQKNDASRSYYNTAIAEALAHLHMLDPEAEVLMDTSGFPSIVPHAGLTYRETINESDKQFYQAALAAPAANAGIVLAFAGDQIDEAVHGHPEHLRLYQRFRSKDQPDAAIYVSDTLPPALALEPSPATAPR